MNNNINIMQEDGFINYEVVSNLTGYHSRRFCFILGAGASISSGISGASKLIAGWDMELKNLLLKEDYEKWRTDNHITDNNRDSFYTSYYKKRFGENPTDGLNCLEKEMEGKHPSRGYVNLALLMENTDNNVVITTNFDHLLEDSFLYFTKSMPKVIGHESLAYFIEKEEIKQPTIVKIHRDLLFDPKNTEEAVEELHGNWIDALDNIFSRYYPVFIGYAGNDKSLMDFLNNNTEKFSGESWKTPYWVLYGKNRLPEMAEKFLTAVKGTCVINSQGFDYLITSIIDKLKNVKQQSREEFLERMGELYDKAFKEPLTSKSPGGGDEERSTISENNSEDDIFENTYLCKVVSVENEKGSDYSETDLNEKDTSELEAEYYNCIAIKKYSEAEVISKCLIEKDRENSFYYSFLGNALYCQKKYEEAEKECRKAIELNPEVGYYYILLGNALFWQKKYKEVEKEYRKAIELNPEDEYYHSGLGNALYCQKKCKEAEKEYRKAIELNPEVGHYYTLLGNALYCQKKCEEAEKEYRKAIELNPEDGAYHNSLGKALYMQDKYEEAEKEYRKVIELNPEKRVYCANLRRVLSTQNKCESNENEK